MLRLLSLLQTRREWAGLDLAGRLGVTVRTVRRDVDRLRELGYPVDSARGHGGGYRLASGTDLPPLLATLAVACRDHEILTFDYTTRHGATASRRAEPCHLVASGSLWYLLAHDVAQDDWRVFRLDRMSDPTPTGRRVPPRPVPGEDPAAFVADRLAAAPTRYRAVATVQASAEHVRAHTRGLAARIRPGTADTCLVDASDDSLTHIAQTLATLGADYALDADPEVVRHLRATARRALRSLTAETGQDGA
ncbi:hypothetical protein ADK52_37505 [Streptomyces sp. WM6372]|nr:hypothetical protein ADK52_37505 [Streptomyces sp. WM6372]